MSGDYCERCGATGTPLRHAWVEGDCILPHRSHAKATIGHICTGCVDRHREWLDEIVTLYASLPNYLLAGSIPDDTAEHKRPRKAPASPSPIRLDAWALLHPGQVHEAAWDRYDGWRHTYLQGIPDVPAVLSGWAAACTETLGWTTSPPVTVSGASALLQAHADTMARTADVDTYDAELRWVRRALRSACGIDDPEPLFGCLTVGCGGNVWQMTTGLPTCDRCGRRYGTLDCVRARGHEVTERRLRSDRSGTGRA